SRSVGLASTSPGLPSPWPTPALSSVSRRRKRECSRKRTGTWTVLSARGRTSLFAMSSGNFSRTAERTLSLCLSQSRAPREKRSYQCRSAPGRSMKSDDLVSTARSSLPLLLRQQGSHVVERLFRAVRVVAVLLDQPLLDSGNLLLGVLVGPRTRG